MSLPFAVRTLEGTTRRFGSLESAVRFARRMAKASVVQGASWTVVDARDASLRWIVREGFGDVTHLVNGTAV